MLLDELKKANIEAMKVKDKDARSVISVVLTKCQLLQVEAKASGKDFNDPQVLEVIQKVLKELSDEKEGYAKVGNTERVESINHQEEVIKATGHVPVIDSGVEATCESKGLTEGSHCSVCGEILVEQKEIDEAHEYEIINKVDPTYEEDGYIEYKCSKCGDVYKKTLTKLSFYDPTSPTVIELVDDSSLVTNDNGGVSIEGNTIVITLGGEYTISGNLSEGNIIVRMYDESKATLNLAGVNITSELYSLIYIESGNKVEISAKNGSENYLYDKREYDQRERTDR